MAKKKLNSCRSCNSCDANQNGVFKWLNTVEIKNIDDSRQEQHFEPGQVIFSEDQIKHGLYCIRSGAIKISKKTHDKKKSIVMRIMGAGDFIGSSGSETAKSYTYTATALEKVVACHIPQKIMDGFVDNSRFSRGMISALSRDLAQNEKILCNLTLRSLREKFAYVLFDLSTRFGVPTESGTLIQLKISRSDLAALCGTVIESTARILSEFEEEGYIHLQKRKIIITNVVKLKKIAGVDIRDQTV